jgi:hypothetical protein
MEETPHDDEILSGLGHDRRAFVKRAVAVTAFATPMIVSYDLDALSPSVAHAAAVGNSSHPLK